MAKSDDRIAQPSAAPASGPRISLRREVVRALRVSTRLKAGPCQGTALPPPGNGGGGWSGCERSTCDCTNTRVSE